jgi:hypothetical protein
MKITYTLTFTEAINHLKEIYFNKGMAQSIEDIQVEIIVNDNIRQSLLNAVGYVIPSHEKIAKIKALRQWSMDNPNLNSNKETMGLADAKCAVENWNEFLDFVEKNNRLPKPGFYASGSYISANFK